MKERGNEMYAHGSCSCGADKVINIRKVADEGMITSAALTLACLELAEYTGTGAGRLRERFMQRAMATLKGSSEQKM